MKLLFEDKSKFNHIKVLEEGDIRTLIFEGDSFSHSNIQSAISLSDPHRPVLKYYEAFLTVARFYSPRNVLMIGLGAGFLPRELKFYFGSEIDIIEIDPAVVYVANNFFGFSSLDFKIHIGDAFQVIRYFEKNYDCIFMDAFSSQYIPFHLMTTEFLSEIKRISNGVVMFNAGNKHPSYQDFVYTIEHSFGPLHILEVNDTSIIFNECPDMLRTDSRAIPVKYCSDITPKPLKSDLKSKLLSLYR